VDAPAFVGGDLQQFVDGFAVAEAVQREGEQPPLNYGITMTVHLMRSVVRDARRVRCGRDARADRGRGRSGNRIGADHGAGEDRAGAMIPIPSGVRVWLATGHTDIRKGFDGLAVLVQEQLQALNAIGGLLHHRCFARLAVQL